MSLNVARYTSRRRRSSITMALCWASAALGLTVLAVILSTLVIKGFSGLSAQVFLADTPPPGSDGGLRNAIPRESNAAVAVPADKAEAFTKNFNALRDAILAEYSTTDPEMKIEAAPADAPAKVMAAADQRGFLRAVQAAPNGIFRMSPDVKDLVQTSNNVARVQLGGGSFTVMCLTRSSVESEKMDEADTLRAAFELIGAEVKFAGGYPGWTPRPDSKIVQLMTAVYQEIFKEQPHVLACHAGLECGIIGRNYPGMEMISFGPTIRGAHSPDERANIPSVQKFWKYLQEVLGKL